MGIATSLYDRRRRRLRRPSGPNVLKQGTVGAPEVKKPQSRYASSGTSTRQYVNEAEMAQDLIENNSTLSPEEKQFYRSKYRNAFPDRSVGGLGTAVYDPNDTLLKGRRHALLIQLENDRAKKKGERASFSAPSVPLPFFIDFKG